ncbi:hypothetical protein yfred0001_1430 [Yersinia frederiksenii ATCC 33641]|nr:hypothetical protein yfred0001_1430 [Yersinia frederiksenii ATCC 33641]
MWRQYCPQTFIRLSHVAVKPVFARINLGNLMQSADYDSMK